MLYSLGVALHFSKLKSPRKKQRWHLVRVQCGKESAFVVMAPHCKLGLARFWGLYTTPAARGFSHVQGDRFNYSTTIVQAEERTESDEYF
ncbi:hypothetical protein PM082_021664 [Marasmius tenuissimus]|nr:hypothetical protein PM082_021664 [Marasmius tenuissimus]